MYPTNLPLPVYQIDLNLFSQILSTSTNKGLYIGENIRVMYDLISYTDNNQIPGLFLMIDFEKAFDSVSHTFLQNILDKFNFGPSIKQSIRVFYNQATSSVLVNGFLSQSFNIDRGCRQVPIYNSPYLFILCGEVLGKMIRNNRVMKGIEIEGIEYRICR